MKLTVCFGPVKVIVPCGDGELTVNDFIEKATSRYIKASQKENVDEIYVKHLQTEDAAILDHDDIIADVCDDRDKLIAVFEDRSQFSTERVDLSRASHIRASSQSTSSSVSGLSSYHLERDQPVAPPPNFENGEAQTVYGVDKESFSHNEKTAGREDGRERRRERPWKSSEVLKSSNSQPGHYSSNSSTPMSSPDPSKDALGFNGFDRNFNRKSLSVGHPLLYSWIDAQEKINQNTHAPSEEKPDSRPPPITKRLSTGQDGSSATSVGDFDDIDDISSTTSEEIELESRLREDFGLRVQGYKNADGKELGLIVHEIKNDTIMGKNGSLNVADRITEVNGVNLRDKTNTEAENILNDALAYGTIRLKRTRSHHFIRASLRGEYPSERTFNLPRVPESAIVNSKEAPKIMKPIAASDPREAPIEDPKNEVSAPKPVQGKTIAIELRKGATGLGFSITSRDVTTKEANPVYVKNILPRGAAIQDGRLKVGDQITEINGVDVSNKDQTEIVNILKKATGTVRLLVYRQQNEDTAEVDESDDAIDTISNDSGIATIKEEILSMNIPLDDLGSAGLGISVKGKTSAHDKYDLGIFVKSIIKGGAASKDGRLKPEDRLLQINEISLDGVTNEKAMESLRQALTESVKKGFIRIVIARKAKPEVIDPVPNGKPELILPPLDQIGIRDSKTIDGQDEVSPGRNSSRFNTVNIKPASNEDTEIQRSQHRPKPHSDQIKQKTSSQDTVKFVSVSSSEIPVTQPCKTVIIERSPNTDSRQRLLVEVKSTVYPKEKQSFYQDGQTMVKEGTRHSDGDNKESFESIPTPPSYQEALKRRSISSSDNASNRGSSFSSQQQPFQPDLEDGEWRKDMDLLRTMSTSSRFSLDSLMMSPDAMPFSRDAFGRLSMSERKGRAHLDATKSDFYSRLKKSKSLENVHSNIVPFHEAVRRTESLDTLLNSSHNITEEEDAFRRNSILSKSTPWYAQRTVSPTALKLRSRSTAWNDSFRNAVDKTQVFYTQSLKEDGGRQPVEKSIPLRLTSNANYIENQQSRKKTGLFKGLGNLLKKGKLKKPEGKTENRESTKGNASNGGPVDYPRRERPHSVHEETISHQRNVVHDPVREIEYAKWQKEERLALLQKELNKVEKEEHQVNKKIIDRNERLIYSNGDTSVKGISYDVRTIASKEVRPLTQGQVAGKMGEHKSLLQRGQERIQMKEKKQNSDQPVVQDVKGIETARKTALTETERNPSYRSSQRQTIRDEPKSRPGMNDFSMSHSTSQPAMQQHGTGSNEHKGPIAAESETEQMPANRVSRELNDEDAASKQRYLPSSQLFYYGHSSLPRKFTVNHARSKNAAESKQLKKYSVEEQAEAFKRAQPKYEDFEVRGSKRAAVQRRNQMQGNVNQNAGSITISHAANI
ncbi:partitioning defective 3 homolog isoform X2 [Rhopilema esculentum]|uniref:partitioning defective 3 homolog isoform X2 n=1 Tax=Rhopilema esculentum TaxID=499914 RepID=UPI0031DDE25A